MTSPTSAHELRVPVSPAIGDVSAVLVRPARAGSLLVLAHGAGAGMRHAFLEAIAGRLASTGTASLRYQFPYMERGSHRPDPPPILLATVRAAVAAGAEAAGDLPLFAGGKSMGGRMTSLSASEAPLGRVKGLVLLGFPLHPSGRPGVERGRHLAGVDVPMLFVSGDRDKLADLDLLRDVCGALGARATLRVFMGADHSFAVLRRSGRSSGDVLDELAECVAGWVSAIVGSR
jgi:predicted alpha/beta-hydrolase family hydrolase